MKPKQFLIPFLIISFILVLSASYQLNFEPKTELHVNQMEIEFDGLNATATIDYDVGFLTQMYVFFFGNRNLIPYVEDFLFSYEEIQIVSVNETRAEVRLINSSRIVDSHAIHDKHPLGSKVTTLIQIYPAVYPNPNKDIRTYTNMTYTNSSITPLSERQD